MHRQRRWRRGRRLGWLLAILLAGAGVAPSIASRSALDSHPLVRQARAQGPVRVIVNLAVPVTPEGQLTGPQAIAAQRARIAHAQEQLAAALLPFAGIDALRYHSIPAMVVEVDAAGIAFLLRSPLVALVEPDELLVGHLDDTIPLIKADDVHFYGQAGAGTAIAILDTGVKTSHPFLAGKVVAEACRSTISPANNARSFCPNGQEAQDGTGAGRPCPQRGCEHGTHVAGIALGGSAGSPHAPSSGVAPNAGLIPVQVFAELRDGSPTPEQQPCANKGQSSPCMGAFQSAIIAGLERVQQLAPTHNIVAVNLSLGGGSNTSACRFGSYATAIKNLLSIGVATVVSAGNDSSRNAISTPACQEAAVSVGATTKRDLVADYSNVASFVTLLAPGSDIVSAVGSDGYAESNGTSMAAPHVTGAIALLKEIHPAAPITEVIRALRDSGPLVRDTRTGGTVSKRRLDVRAALVAMGGTEPSEFRTYGFDINYFGSIASADDRDIGFFNGTAGQQVTLSMRQRSSSVDSVLTVYAPDGRLLVTDDNGGGGLDALINQFPLPDHGRYKVVLSGRGTIGPYTFSITARGASTNPVPRIDKLSPDGTALSPSMTAVTVRVQGHNFLPSSVIQLNGASVSTTFRDSTELTTRVTREQLQGQSTATFRVLNPPPGGGASNSKAFTIQPSSVGISELSPAMGQSTVGVTVTFVLSWTHPTRWRELSSIDLRLRDAQNSIPLWVRFIEGQNSTLVLLNGAEQLVDQGAPGEPRELRSDTARLDLSRSALAGTGADGPSVTITLTVALLPAAAGTYNLELLALDDSGAFQGPDLIGSWSVLWPHEVFAPMAMLPGAGQE